MMEVAVTMRCLAFSHFGEGKVRTVGNFGGLNAIYKHQCVDFKTNNSVRFSICAIKTTPFFGSSRFSCGDGLRCIYDHMLGRNDIVVVNFGIWYQDWKDNMQLKTDITSYISRARIQNKSYRQVKWFWLETFAQHFPTYGGVYRPKMRENACAYWNMTNPKENLEANWRNEITSTQVVNQKLIKLVPIWNFTAMAPLTEHIGKNGQNKLDCTHWWLGGIPMTAAKEILKSLNEYFPINCL